MRARCRADRGSERDGGRDGERGRGLLRLPAPDPYLETWLALTPAERLRRSWRLRLRVKDLGTVHDAKSLPEL